MRGFDSVPLRPYFEGDARQRDIRDLKFRWTMNLGESQVARINPVSSSTVIYARNITIVSYTAALYTSPLD